MQIPSRYGFPLVVVFIHRRQRKSALHVPTLPEKARETIHIYQHLGNSESVMLQPRNSNPKRSLSHGLNAIDPGHAVVRAIVVDVAVSREEPLEEDVGGGPGGGVAVVLEDDRAGLPGLGNDVAVG